MALQPDEANIVPAHVKLNCSLYGHYQLFGLDRAEAAALRNQLPIAPFDARFDCTCQLGNLRHA